jgi:TatA/E family protein of Tat protein translocase
MFGPLGGPELVLILVLALIVFGPRRLPEIGKSMGRLLAEFRKASHDFQRTIEDEVEAEKYKPAADPVPPAAAPAPVAPAPAAPAEDVVPRDAVPPPIEPK